MKNRIDTSRKKTPWDNKNNINPTEKFVKDKYKDNYNNKNTKLYDTSESEMLNSIILDRCKRCDSENIKKYGFSKNGVQRYYCNDCKREFSVITGTIFQDHKISITEWVEYILDILYYGSYSLTSRVNKNSMNTAIYWINKIFLLLKDYQDDIILKNNVYIDEFFYSVIKSDIKIKNNKKLRGISQNKYCIGIGFDHKNVIVKVECLGKTTTDITTNTFINHIENGSTLIHDDEKSHKKIVKQLHLKEKCYKSKDLKKLNDKNNPLRPINHICDLLRQFLNAHSGFDRDNLQDLLNLFSFIMSRPRNNLEKVEILLEKALTTNNTLKYRDLFDSKENNGNESDGTCK